MPQQVRPKEGINWLGQATWRMIHDAHHTALGTGNSVLGELITQSGKYNSSLEATYQI